MNKTTLLYLITSSIVGAGISLSAAASEQCPAQYTQFSTSQSYAAFFESLAKGPVFRPERQPEGLLGEPVYPELFGRWVPASYQSQSLSDRSWHSWKRADWNLVLNELRRAKPAVASDYSAQQVGQLEQKIKGVECYANTLSGNA